jgi:hypothetical protein
VPPYLLEAGVVEVDDEVGGEEVVTGAVVAGLEVVGGAEVEEAVVAAAVVAAGAEVTAGLVVVVVGVDEQALRMRTRVNKSAKGTDRRFNFSS